MKRAHRGHVLLGRLDRSLARQAGRDLGASDGIGVLVLLGRQTRLPGDVVRVLLVRVEVSLGEGVDEREDDLAARR